MIRLAVLGDIGSGKSHVAKKFGYPVFNADKEVTKIYKNNKKSYNQLKKIFPNYITSFPIKKEDLLKIVIKNKNNIKKINKIIHKEVRKKMNFFLKRNKKKKLIILDIPLFLENKLEKKKDILIFIDAKRKDINKRLIKRKNFNLRVFSRLRKLQLPLEFKKKKSQFIIKNKFKDKMLKKDVKDILKKIL